MRTRCCLPTYGQRARHGDRVARARATRRRRSRRTGAARRCARSARRPRRPAPRARSRPACPRPSTSSCVGASPSMRLELEPAAGLVLELAAASSRAGPISAGTISGREPDAERLGLRLARVRGAARAGGRSRSTRATGRGPCPRSDGTRTVRISRTPSVDVVAGHLDQAERRDLDDVALGAILLELLLDRLQHGVAVLLRWPCR